MNLDGSGSISDSAESRGESDSDFYTTFRGRVGVAWNHWLLYGTGGGIGINYETRFVGANFYSGGKTEFNWGYTLGGGMEYMLGCHWSLRAEYLYFETDTQRFTIHTTLGPATYAFEGNTEGNIVRAGLNYKF
jgi:outer membrane immunogenic protein